MKFTTSAITSFPTAVSGALMFALLYLCVALVTSTFILDNIATSGTKMVAAPCTGNDTWSILVVLTFVESHILCFIG